MKTSKEPLPDSFAVPSLGSTKWNSHVKPAEAAGKSKVTSVVMSDVTPSLKILPAVTSKSTAPVQTVYCEMVEGRMTLEPLGMFWGRGEGRAEVKAKMARAVAAVRKCIVVEVLCLVEVGCIETNVNW